jgi:serine phosphatase RsbU (regulator of sigma subunit)
MGSGDILVLHTDGLREHARGDEQYFPNRLEALLREIKDRSALQMVDVIFEDLRAFARPADDISLVIIKRT